MDPERPNIASAVKEYVKGDNFEVIVNFEDVNTTLYI
jgi:hypothetical protein